MKKYAIFFDLDETLLSTYNTVSNETIATMKQLHKLGHHLFISTGRQFYSSIPFHKQLGFTTPLITLNGGTIYQPDGTLLQSSGLDTEFIEKLLTHSVAKEVLLVTDFETPNLSLVTEEEEHLLTFLTYQMPQGELPNVEQLDSTNKHFLQNTVNIYSFLEKKNLSTFANFLAEHMPDTIDYRLAEQNGGVFYEFFPKNINKATGIQFLTKYLNLENMPTMAFGDGTNDVEMITHVTHGVAMSNGCQEVKDACNTKTIHSNKDSGVAKYLQDFFEITI